MSARMSMSSPRTPSMSTLPRQGLSVRFFRVTATCKPPRSVPAVACGSPGAFIQDGLRDGIQGASVEDGYERHSNCARRLGLETAHEDNHIVSIKAVDEQFAGKILAIPTPSVEGNGTAAKKGEPRVDALILDQIGIGQLGEEH